MWDHGHYNITLHGRYKESHFHLWCHKLLTSPCVMSHITHISICDVTYYSHHHLWCHILLTSLSVNYTKKITFAFVSSQIPHKSRVRSRKTLSSRKKTWLKREFFFSTWVFCEFYSRKSHVFVTSVDQRFLDLAASWRNVFHMSIRCFFCSEWDSY